MLLLHELNLSVAVTDRAVAEIVARVGTVVGTAVAVVVAVAVRNLILGVDSWV